MDWHAPASSQPILRHTTRKRRRSATLGRHAAARSVGRRRALLAWIRRIVGSQDVELVPLAVNVRRRARSGTCGSGRVGLASVTGQDQPGLALCTAWSRSRRRVSIPALMSVIVGGGGCLTTGWQRGTWDNDGAPGTTTSTRIPSAADTAGREGGGTGSVGSLLLCGQSGGVCGQWRAGSAPRRPLSSSRLCRRPSLRRQPAASSRWR